PPRTGSPGRLKDMLVFGHLAMSGSGAVDAPPPAATPVFGATIGEARPTAEPPIAEPPPPSATLEPPIATTTAPAQPTDRTLADWEASFDQALAGVPEAPAAP